MKRIPGDSEARRSEALSDASSSSPIQFRSRAGPPTKISKFPSASTSNWCVVAELAALKGRVRDTRAAIADMPARAAAIRERLATIESRVSAVRTWLPEIRDGLRQKLLTRAGRLPLYSY